MAADVVGTEKFHQVAMGQGQADIAMKLLHDCSRNGEWLCLKNLHLVNAWLPTLEKVYNLCNDIHFSMYMYVHIAQMKLH